MEEKQKGISKISTERGVVVITIATRERVGQRKPQELRSIGINHGEDSRTIHTTEERGHSVRRGGEDKLTQRVESISHLKRSLARIMLT